MNIVLRVCLGLLACLCLQPAWSADPVPDVVEECIAEPIFEGKVCTLQANREAETGVILIHGLGGSMDDWKNVIPALAADFHVLAFDLPGFGKSDKGSQEYSPTRYARLANYLADRYFPGKNYHIVGHSMGGAIALRFASQRPQRFQRLVLIDAAGILHPQVLTRFQAGSVLERSSGTPLTRDLTELVSGKLLEEVDRLPISPFDIVNSALGRDYVLQGGPNSIAALKLAGEDFSDAVTSVTEPVLILWGDSDLTVPQRTGQVLAARMPHARLEIIDAAGHEPMQDQPLRTNQLIRSHLLASDKDIADQFAAAPPLPEFTSERVGTCTDESGMLFEGDYLSIELNNCTGVVIRNARVKHLKVTDSWISLLDTDISGNEEALHSFNSYVTITNGNISGEIAINSERSRFDLAGVHLAGSRDAVKAVGSKFVFSISRAHSPHMDGPLHIYKKMNNEVL
ncbi:MAG: alpha/beta hydrolase [Sideroxyarcus sp.]|nr:alpha/beta hydrolase [Sideroxyarcus sp.]